jgi:hypothetical protein
MYVDDSMWILFGNALCLFKLLERIVRDCRVVPMTFVVLGVGEETEQE